MSARRHIRRSRCVLLLSGSAVSADALSVVEGAAEVTFELGLLAIDQMREATFDVRVDDPIAVGVESLVVQGAVDSDLLPSTLTDDPALPGSADPTVTTVTAAPRLVASMVDVLVVSCPWCPPGDRRVTWR